MVLNFNYDLAIRQATQIEDIACEMRKLANGQMSNAIATIDASWDGDTSSIFLRHCGETKQQVVARAGELECNAQRIRSVARVLRDAEETAKRIIGLPGGGGSSSGGGRG